MSARFAEQPGRFSVDGGILFPAARIPSYHLSSTVAQDSESALASSDRTGRARSPSPPHRRLCNSRTAVTVLSRPEGPPPSIGTKFARRSSIVVLVPGKISIATRSMSPSLSFSRRGMYYCTDDVPLYKPARPCDLSARECTGVTEVVSSLSTWHYHTYCDQECSENATARSLGDLAL